MSDDFPTKIWGKDNPAKRAAVGKAQIRTSRALSDGLPYQSTANSAGSAQKSGQFAALEIFTEEDEEEIEYLLTKVIDDGVPGVDQSEQAVSAKYKGPYRTLGYIGHDNLIYGHLVFDGLNTENTPTYADSRSGGPAADEERPVRLITTNTKFYWSTLYTETELYTYTNDADELPSMMCFMGHQSATDTVFFNMFYPYRDGTVNHYGFTRQGLKYSQLTIVDRVVTKTDYTITLPEEADGKDIRVGMNGGSRYPAELGTTLIPYAAMFTFPDSVSGSFSWTSDYDPHLYLLLLEGYGVTETTFSGANLWPTDTTGVLGPYRGTILYDDPVSLADLNNGGNSRGWECCDPVRFKQNEQLGYILATGTCTAMSPTAYLWVYSFPRYGSTSGSIDPRGDTRAIVSWSLIGKLINTVTYAVTEVTIPCPSTWNDVGAILNLSNFAVCKDGHVLARVVRSVDDIGGEQPVVFVSSSDYGATWTQLTPAGLPSFVYDDANLSSSPVLLDVVPENDPTKYTYGIVVLDGTDLYLYYSVDFGITWEGGSTRISDGSTLAGYASHYSALGLTAYNNATAVICGQLGAFVTKFSPGFILRDLPGRPGEMKG